MALFFYYTTFVLNLWKEKHGPKKHLIIEDLNTKKEINDKIDSFKTVNAKFTRDPETLEQTLFIKGPGKVMMAKGNLTEADKKWIIEQLAIALKPIQSDVAEINKRLGKIENCPTIKKELAEINNKEEKE